MYSVLSSKSVIYVNLGIFLDALLILHFVCRFSKSTTSHVEDALNGEKFDYHIQTFGDHFSFQQLRRNQIGLQLW